MLDVVKRISLMAQKNAPLRMKFEDGALEISAETPDIGEARESLPAPLRPATTVRPGPGRSSAASYERKSRSVRRVTLTHSA